MILRPNFLLLLILSALLLLPIVGYAQQSQADVATQLEGTTGETRLDILLNAAASDIELEDETCLTWATEALELAVVLGDEEKISASKIALGQALYINARYTEAVEHLRAAEIANEAIGNFERVAEANLFLGKSYNMLAHYDSARTTLQNSLAISRKIGDQVGTGNALSNLATNARYLSDYDQSATYRFEAMAIWQAIGDSNLIASELSAIGILYYFQDEFDKALEQFKICNAYWRGTNDSSSLGFCTTLLALANFELGHHDESIAWSLESLAIREAIGDIRGQGESLNNLSLAHMSLEHWEEALGYLEKALKLLEQAQDYRQRPILLANMGAAKLSLGDTEAAISYFRQSLAYAQEDNNKGSVHNAYKKIHRAFAKANQYDSAYHYYRLYTVMNDSLYSEEKSRAVSELSIQYESAQKEQENALLRQEAENRKQQQLVVALSLGGGLLVLLLIVILLMQRIKRSRQVFTAQQQLTEAKLINAQQELDYHRNKLSDYTRNLLEKNRLLEQLQQDLATQQDAKPNHQETIPNLLEIKILTDADWDDFKRLFENVHTGFHARLRQKHHDLSEGEQRLFLLLRLNLNTKEIANILGVAPDSVKKARYRLRKKLSLREEDNLQAVVASF